MMVLQAWTPLEEQEATSYPAYRVLRAWPPRPRLSPLQPLYQAPLCRAFQIPNDGGRNHSLYYLEIV